MPADTEELQAGFSALDQRDYDRAQSAADEYLQQHPADGGAAEAQYLRGRAIEQRVKRSDAEATANLREARFAYESALQLNPSRPLEGYVRTSLGNVFYWQDDYAAAEAQWTQSYEQLDREDLKSWVLYRIGLSRQRQAKWTSADAAFAEVTKNFPGTEPAQRATAHQGARAFYVQVAAFVNPASAEKTALSLRSRGFPASSFERQPNRLQIVRAGPLRRYADAVTMRDRLAAEYHDALIVP
jgi:outer membrane protein assembly factor BamD (BamD/ComL family)